MAAPALVEAMNDDAFGVRWLAAEGLITLRRQGLGPLLQALIEHPDAMWLRESAHHVIKVLADDEKYFILLAPILNILECPASAEAVSQAACNVLKQLCQDEHAGSESQPI